VNALCAVAVNLILLCLLAATAWHLRGRRVLAVLLWAQCFYWLIAYAGRALVLLLVQPVPRADDALADPRLYRDSYFSSVPHVLWIVNGGLAVYVLAVGALARRWGGAPDDRRTDGGPARDCASLLAWCTYVLGWGFRLASYSHAVPWPPLASVVTSLALFGPLGVGLLLARTATAETKGRFALLTVTLLGAEIGYSALIQSKAPALSVLLFAVLGFVLRGWRPGRAMLVVGLVGFVGLFPALQSLKETAAVSGAIASAEQHYPALWRPLLPVLRRFDLLNAATDAAYFPGGHWLGWDYLLRLLHGLVPFATPGSWVPYETAGLSWAAEIRIRSLPNSGISVSLAEGFIGEGYVWLGWTGVSVLGLALAMVTILLSRMVTSRQPFSFSAAILLLSQPTIFERGLLGIADGAGQSVQAALAFVGLWWLLNGRTVHGFQAEPAPRYVGALPSM
jgi:hypothetical protein